MIKPRQGFGIEGLDRRLGGGLLPGSLTVIAGATGAGKTQMGLRWLDAGQAVERSRGIVCDLTSRGDAQNHAAYAREQLDWELVEHPVAAPIPLENIWDRDHSLGEYYHPFARAGRRVTRRDLEPDEWHAWKTDLARILRDAATYFHAQFVRGVRRVVVDGVEPTDRFAESIQFEFFEYLYHHVMRQPHDWAAREVLREHFRAHEAKVLAHPYESESIGCLYLYTTPHIMLDDLIVQPIGEGDIFTNANTIIYMGRVRESGRVGRALYVAKHRGSACSDDIIPYSLTDRGPVIGDPSS